MEKKQVYYASLAGMQNGAVTLEDSLVLPIREINTTVQSSDRILNIHPRGNKNTRVHKNPYTYA